MGELCMERISQSIVDFISRNMIVDDEEMLDVYKYGIEITLSSVLNFVLIIISSLILRDITAGAVFMVLFIFLRSYTGGYHAETYLRCNIAFVCTFFITYFIAKLFEYIDSDISIFAITAISYIPIWIFSPVKNRHKVLNEKKQKRSRIISTVIFFLSLIMIVLLCLHNIKYGYLLAATDIAVSVLILVEVYMQKKGYHPSGD